MTDKLRAALEDAIECVESWSAYADDYFKTKHDLVGDLKRLREAADEPAEQPDRAAQGREAQAADDAIWHELLAERDELLAALKMREPLKALSNAELMIILLNIDSSTQRLPDGFIAFARAIEQHHGIGAKP